MTFSSLAGRLLLVVLFVAGCQPAAPTIDCTDDAAFLASLRTIQETLPAHRRKALVQALLTIGMTKTADVEKPIAHVTVATQVRERMKPLLHGLDADEIIAFAHQIEEERKLERARREAERRENETPEETAARLRRERRNDVRNLLAEVRERREKNDFDEARRALDRARTLWGADEDIDGIGTSIPAQLDAAAAEIEEQFLRFEERQALCAQVALDALEVRQVLNHRREPMVAVRFQLTNGTSEALVGVTVQLTFCDASGAVVHAASLFPVTRRGDLEINPIEPGEVFAMRPGDYYPVTDVPATAQIPDGVSASVVDLRPRD